MRSVLPDETVMLRMAYAVLTEIAAQRVPGVTELARAWCEMYRTLREGQADKTPAETPLAKLRNESR